MARSINGTLVVIVRPLGLFLSLENKVNMEINLVSIFQSETRMGSVTGKTRIASVPGQSGNASG